MKKIKFLIPVLFVSLIFIFASCEKEEMTQEFVNTDDLNFLALKHNPDYMKKSKSGGIITVELWELNYDINGNEICRKLGICHVYILGHQVFKSDISDEIDGRVIRTPIVDSLGDKYVKFYYAQDVSYIPKDSLLFKVTREFLVDSSNNQYWFIPAGSYPFKENIGKYGGYEIKLEKY